MVIIAYVLISVSLIKILFMIIFKYMSGATRNQIKSRIKQAEEGQVEFGKLLQGIQRSSSFYKAPMEERPEDMYDKKRNIKQQIDWEVNQLSIKFGAKQILAQL